jgi:hypothetical protein
MMEFHADSATTFSCGDYRVVWGIRGWAAYNYARRKAILIRDVRLGEALAVCQEDFNAIQAETR